MAPGFAFRTCEGGIGDQGLLTGRSAQLITTMDTPPLIHRLLYREPGSNALARATLGFCGSWWTGRPTPGTMSPSCG